MLKYISQISVFLFFHAVLYSQVISGFVREAATGEPLSYVNVFIKDTYLGAATNQDGYYVIPNVPSGEYEVSASIIGYESLTKNVQIKTNENLRLDFRLVVSAIVGEEVTVTAERQKFIQEVDPSRVTLDLRQIKAVPAFIEADVFRTLQLLPGVQTINDFSSALYVRGSTPDQNLIMLDGITVYNPYHLGGVFSTFNTDAIKEADFHAGGFGARYGGRMGSILNIINREGNTEEFTGNFNLSWISAKGLIEGPLPTWRGLKGSWMLAGRRTFYDKIMRLVTIGIKKAKPQYANNMPDNIFPYYFYDLEGKINLDIYNNHRLTLSSFYGDDVFDIRYNTEYENTFGDGYYHKYNKDSVFDWRWGNRTNSLTWRWIVTPKLIAKTFLADSRFRLKIDMQNTTTSENSFEGDTSKYWSKYEFDTHDIIKDKTFETELTWLTGKGHTVTGGFQHKQLSYNLGMLWEINSRDNDEKVTTLRDTALWITDNTYEQTVYIQDKWTINSVLSTQFGFRVSRYSPHSKIYYDPRIGLKYFIKEDLSLKANWGRYHQFLTIANPLDENFRFIDIWLGIPKDRPALYADHSIIGIEYLSPNNIIFRGEAYYKDYQNLITLKQGSIFQDDSDQITADFLNEFNNLDAYSYGLELLAQKTSGKFKGWVGYTYAETKWKTDLHGWYNPKFDRKHTLNIVADWQLNKKWHIGTAISASSGNPYTPVLGRIQNWDEDLIRNENWWNQQQYIVGTKNSERYPIYFRWDVSFINRKQTKHGHREWYFQIINLTNHLNTLMYIYGSEYDEIEHRYKGVRRLGIPMFPIMPTIGYRIEF